MQRNVVLFVRARREASPSSGRRAGVPCLDMVCRGRRGCIRSPRRPRPLAPSSPATAARSGWCAPSRQNAANSASSPSISDANRRTVGRAARPRRRGSRGRHRHARSARRRPCDQRGAHAFADRPVARGADRLGQPRAAHAARLDPRRRDRAQRRSRAARTRRSSRRWFTTCATRPSVSTTTSRTCSTPRRISSDGVKPHAGMGRPRRHHPFGPRALPPPPGRAHARDRSAADLPLIHVDPVLVQQALVQIFDNAVKYSQAGSRITIAAQRARRPPDHQRPRSRRRSHACGKSQDLGPLCARRTPCRDHERFRTWPVDRQRLRRRQWRKSQRRQRRARPRHHGGDRTAGNANRRSATGKRRR